MTTPPTVPAGDDPGPAVWLDLAQAALDKAYDQAQWAPNMAQVLQRFGSASEAARQRLGAPRRLRYGPADVEQLDFFDCGREGAPLVVFLHGGAWRSGLARDYAFVAELYLPAGIHLAVPDFAWVQDCNGDLRVVADQVRRAIAWVHEQAGSLGADPDRLFLSGHSSGAHLAAVAAVTDWAARGLPEDLVKGCVLCSGSYDLEPVRRSSRSRYLSIDDAAAHDLSPIRHLDRLSQPLAVAWGSLESPEFQRQGQAMAQAASSAGLSVESLVAEDFNHFEILETLATPAGLLGRAALRQVLGD
ncbi:alpha/beta hydrolase [Piscinibacter sakaiensis]|uniref:alpha/beta hydrolase n=1 Tax=Piscinibacter sakaiensis TaxID=1547922 RepID=UPI003AB06F87